MEYYSVIKNSHIMPFVATRVDIEIFILSEVNMTEKDEYHMVWILCGIQKRMIEMK